MTQEDPKLDPLQAVLRSPVLTREQKVQALRQLAYDARERAVASEEGMIGEDRADQVDLGAIDRALREFGADDVQSGAKQ